MKNNAKFAAVLPLTVLAAITLAASGAPRFAAAQEVPTPPPATSATVAAATIKPVPPLRLDRILARDLAAQLSKATGAVVVADSSVALAAFPFSTVGGPLPQVLKQVAEAMPKGAVVRTIMLPAFLPKAPVPTGDDLTALYTTQENLVVPVMGAKTERDADTVNVLGKLLPQDKAAPIIAALDLRPVYLLTNPKAGDNLVGRSALLQAEGLRLFQAMTPEQRTQAAEQQFDALLNMDSPSRQAMFAQFGQQAQVIQSKIMSMPQAQRDQFMSDVTSGMKLPNPPKGVGGGTGKQ